MSRFADYEFAVVDLETTGLFPKRNHRIVEIAVLVIDGKGSVHQEFTTLVNPERDIGPTRIHGLCASDVAPAPTFDKIAGRVAGLLRNRILVGHNVVFDARFLEAEFERLGYAVSDVPAMCTMTLMEEIGEDGRLKLRDACERFGISIGDAHQALADARATAKLFVSAMKTAFSYGIYHADNFPETQPSTVGAWPDLASMDCALCTRESHTHRARSPDYLGRLVQKLPALRSSPLPNSTVIQYFELLSRVLEDRIVTEAEESELLETATSWGLSADEARVAHTAYLLDLAKAAVADGKITPAERTELEQVAVMLGIDAATLDNLIASAQRRSAAVRNATPGQAPADLIGKSVCFTGESNCRISGEYVDREFAHCMAEAAGLTVAKSVTKGLDILVLADPASQSGKAKKARQIGTRIIEERVFWRMLGLTVE